MFAFAHYSKTKALVQMAGGIYFCPHKLPNERAFDAMISPSRRQVDLIEVNGIRLSTNRKPTSAPAIHRYDCRVGRHASRKVPQ
jgi:hypothetical protein